MRFSRSNREAGGAFTLIEIMVVVVLIGIMTAMILPEMKGTYQDALLRSTGRDLVNACNLAYSRSVSFNQPHRVRIDIVAGKYFVEKRVRDQGQEGFTPVRDVQGSEGTLDKRVKIGLRRAEEGESPGDPAANVSPAAAPAAAPGAGDENVIGFYPDGTADSAEVMLQDREGFRLALRINPTTSRVRVAMLGRETAAPNESSGTE